MTLETFNLELPLDFSPGHHLEPVDPSLNFYISKAKEIERLMTLPQIPNERKLGLCSIQRYYFKKYFKSINSF